MLIGHPQPFPPLPSIPWRCHHNSLNNYHLLWWVRTHHSESLLIYLIPLRLITTSDHNNLNGMWTLKRTAQQSQQCVMLAMYSGITESGVRWNFSLQFKFNPPPHIKLPLLKGMRAPLQLFQQPWFCMKQWLATPTNHFLPGRCPQQIHVHNRYPIVHLRPHR